MARIQRPWGFHGLFRVEVLTDTPERFARGSRLYVRAVPHTVEASRPFRNQRLVKLEGVDSPEAVRALTGATLDVPESELRPLPEGTYYHYHLLGMRVVSTGGEALGEIAEIVSTGGNDVYVVRGPRGELLLPATSDVIMGVDVPGGLMTVELLPGLL